MDADKKQCPLCGEEILAVAVKCRYCGEYLDPSARPRPNYSAIDRSLAPVGRPGSAITAGYLALFSLVPVFGLLFAVLAVMFGIQALKAIKEDPGLSGKGRAWFGIIVGGLMTVISVLFILLLIIGLMAERG